MKKLALLGAGGHGKVVADLAQLSGWNNIIFFDDSFPERQINGVWPIHGTTKDLLDNLNHFDGVLVSIGDCAVRLNHHLALKEAGAALVSLTHPNAVVSEYAQIGLGCVIMAGTVINFGVKIGDACIVNTGATIDHDCQLANAVHICPGANLSGEVSVAQASWVGVGSAIRQGIKIGSHVLVGAGSVVVADVADNLTVVGNPTKILAPRNS
jgi:sugar O-acyltransferase (sialic acid O-acetyltransferase NeuD family)